MPKLNDITGAELADYVLTQIGFVVPDGQAPSFRALLRQHLDGALERTQFCIDAVKPWRAGEFNHLHSSQYCIFLYYLSNSIWKATKDPAFPTRLFLLNKALNGIDLFYEIEMPRRFFIGHSVGIVLAKASYGEYLVLYQNSTVGRSGSDVPRIGERVILHPNCSVIGRAVIADGSVLSQGVRVINRETIADKVVYEANGGQLLFKDPQHRMIEEFFRL